MTQKKKQLLTDAKKLDRCVELMNDTGAHWTKGRLKGPLPDGSYAYCSLGAIMAVTRSRETQDRLVNHVLDEAQAMARQPLNNSLTFWNDTRKSWNTIRKAFEKAAEALRDEAAKL